MVTTYGPDHDAMHPPKGSIVLYVGHGCGEEDVEGAPAIRTLAHGAKSLCVVDPRGFGQSLARRCGSAGLFDVHGADHLYASNAEMLGESYLGGRVFEVMLVMDFLLAGKPESLELFGRGLGSVIAAFAGLLHAAEPKSQK